MRLRWLFLHEGQSFPRREYDVQNEVLDVLSFPEEELAALRAAHTAVMEFLTGHGLKDLTDHDAYFDLFYDEDLRFEYVKLFGDFTKALCSRSS
jgi:type I restriction enzyme, R subunit